MITNESLNDKEFDSKAEASVSSLFASGNVPSASCAELHFDKVPPISYDDAPCDWAYMLQPNIIGPFAPRTGWLVNAASKKPIADLCRRSSVLLDPSTCFIKDKAKPSSYFAKMLKKQQNVQHQHVLEEASRREKQEVEDAKHKKARLRQATGFVCEIVQGSKVLCH